MVGPGSVPDPALVVLVGASGSGKSAWAAAHYRAAEIVSSDDLRGVVGSGRHDLDASADAFALLDLVVAGRTRRGLTTVVDTLGLEPERRRSYLALARAHGLPAVVVAFDTPPAVCRRRNAARDRPVPARVLSVQLGAFRAVADRLEGEGWDVVVTRTDTEREPVPQPVGQPVDQPVDQHCGRASRVATVSRWSSSSPGSRGATSRDAGCARSPWPPTRRASRGWR